MVLVAQPHRKRRSEGDESQSEWSVQDSSSTAPYLSSSNAWISSADKRWSNGDLSPLDHRLSAEEIQALDDERYGAVDDESCTDHSDWLSSPSDRLFRCGCATNTIHISAWGELGTCTLQYEHRASLRDHSLKDAIGKVFQAIRARRYQSDSPCRACHVRRFCEKKPSEAHWECGSAEAPIPYNCDVALARAERLVRKPLLHPLLGTQRVETRQQ